MQIYRACLVDLYSLCLFLDSKVLKSSLLFLCLLLSKLPHNFLWNFSLCFTTNTLSCYYNHYNTSYFLPLQSFPCWILPTQLFTFVCFNVLFVAYPLFSLPLLCLCFHPVLSSLCVCSFLLFSCGVVGERCISRQVDSGTVTVKPAEHLSLLLYILSSSARPLPLFVCQWFLR